MFKYFFFSLCIMLSNAQIKYIDHFVQLGDPWSVECNTPYKEPPSWLFVRTDRRYDYYIYTYGKLIDSEKTRYNVTSSNNGQISRLEVLKTDKYHAGYYGCWPDATSLEGRQFYKLTIIENSHMNISINAKKSTTLYMDISYLPFDQIKPVFQCTFPYGKRIMEETICDVYKNSDFVRCSLKKLYEPDDDVPHRCEIFLNNKLWSQENLFLNPESEIEIVMKGTSWNATCETASYYPMKWLFNKDTPHNTSIVLYSKWIPNQNYSQSYNFQVSNDRRVYDMIIPRVDLNHSGTYMCTHKSSDHLIERKIDLIIIGESFIDLINNNKLLMSISYMGNNNILPSFKCDVNNITMNMTYIACQNSEDKLTRCHLIERFENVDVPERCYIFLADQLIEKVVLSDLKPKEKSINIFLITTILLAVIITILLVLLGIITYRKKFMNRQSKKQIQQPATRSSEFVSLKLNSETSTLDSEQEPATPDSTTPLFPDA